MSLPHSFRLTPEMILRVVADIIIVNLSLMLALIGRLFYLIGVEDTEGNYTYSQVFWNYVNVYSINAPLLTLICVVAFSLSGFYTFGTAYQGRYKALIVSQSASLSYLLFGFLAYFLDFALHIPRGALVISWVIGTTLLVAARVWSGFWKKTALDSKQKASLGSRAIKNVLVIGGAGYIGSALIPKLLNKGYRVRLLDLLMYGTEPIREYLDHPRLEVIQSDFRNIDQIVQAMRGMDAAIHLGAIVGDPACALDEDLTIEVNLMATRMIAEVAKGSGVGRFIFASTCSVYGASDELLDEHSSLNPVSLYAQSKIASEKVLRGIASDDFAPTILRFGTIYGLSGRTRFDLVINLLTAKAISESQITVSGGDQWRPFVHVDDAALAVFKALEAPLHQVNNQIFNVGSNDQNFTILQVGELIQKLVPSAELIDSAFDGDRRNYKVNFKKIERVLGFKPQWTVEKGIQQVIEALVSGKVIDYRESKYSNVKFLKDEGGARKIQRQHGWAYELINDSAGVMMIARKENNDPTSVGLAKRV